jgi:hypothetical protein
MVLKALAVSACLVASTPAPLAAAAFYPQTVQLQSGWNAVFLEVAPTNTDPAAVLTGLPLESAWAFQERRSSVDFVQDVNEPVWNRERWSFYVPTNRFESRANSLAEIPGGQPYLLKLTNAATWNVIGRPALKKIAWAPNAYTLAGFPLDPNAPPTFQTYFRPSTAHWVSNALQPIYRLAASGQWTLVTAGTPMKSGEAYWVFCRGGSDYQGPLTVNTDLGNALEFGQSLDVANVGMLNLSLGPVSVTLRDVVNPAGNALAYATFNPTLGFTWPAVPTPLTFSAIAGTNIPVRLAIRRDGFSGTNYETILSINNGAGVRYLLPVSATKSALAAAAAQNPTPMNQALGLAGLWIGSATLTGVSEAHAGTLVTNQFDSQGRPLVIERIGFSPTTTPVAAPMNLRLLIHVDTNGVARLLKEVIQMWKEGTATNDVNGNAVADQPGRYVLLTDTALIPQYTGVTLRDGTSVGRRFSTATFDFPGSSLRLAGLFAPNEFLRGTNSIVAESPTNPFRHKFHPDHKQPDQSFTVVREITMQLLGPGANAPPDYGHRKLRGHYSETVKGLHRTNIVTTGTFDLVRIASTPLLNQ